MAAIVSNFVRIDCYKEDIYPIVQTIRPEWNQSQIIYKVIMHCNLLIYIIIELIVHCLDHIPGTKLLEKNRQTRQGKL